MKLFLVSMQRGRGNREKVRDKLCDNNTDAEAFSDTVQRILLPSCQQNGCVFGRPTSCHNFPRAEETSVCGIPSSAGTTRDVCTEKQTHGQYGVCCHQCSQTRVEFRGNPTDVIRCVRSRTVFGILLSRDTLDLFLQTHARRSQLYKHI